MIVGAGASGLMAAIAAAAHGASVTVLEQNEKPGKKLNATGNGRCNLTNTRLSADAWRGTHPEFVHEALKAFSVEDTLRFFRSLGLEPVNKNGYIYPRCMQALEVTEALTQKARSLGVKIKTREKVTKLVCHREKKDSQKDPDYSPSNPLPAEGVWSVYTDSWHYDCDAVILACGSNASQICGADGSGYLLAQDLGHRIVPPFPALCGLKLAGDGSLFHSWAGVRTEARLHVAVQDKPVCSETGEIQFTDYGISGIPVFQVSRYAVKALTENRPVTVSLDFLPELSEKEASSYWKNRRELMKKAGRREEDLFRGLLPEKLAKLLARQKHSTELVKNWVFPVKAGMDFAQAQVCGGGVDTDQADTKTLESLLWKGLYFTGELLDIDGTCGGYNLQWAWSSGYTAGKSAAEDKDSYARRVEVPYR